MSKQLGAIEETETEASARQKIVVAAQKMLDGKLSFIEGARTLGKLRFPAKLATDPDMRPFIAIDSETDALPFGNIRALWKPKALDALRHEIESAEEWARETGRVHCRNLVKRLSQGLSRC